MIKIKMGKERMHLYSPNINVCYKATIHGSFSNNQLIDTIKKLQKRYPILTCCLQINETKDFFYVSSNNEINTYFANNMESWYDCYSKMDQKPFLFDQENFIRFSFIQNENELELVLLGHHIIADGIGYFNLLKDFLCILDQQLDTTSHLPTIVESIKNDTKTSFLSKLFANSLNKDWDKNKKSFSKQEYLDFFHYYRKKNKSDLCIKTITQETYSILKKNSKKYGYTMNDVITTAFVRSIQNNISKYKNQELKLGIAISVRNENVIPIINNLGNFTSGISLKVKEIIELPFTDSVKILRKKIHKNTKNPSIRYQAIHFIDQIDMDLLDSVPFATYGNYDISVSSKLATVLNESATDRGMGISNIGLMSLPNFQSFKVSDILFIPPAFPANFLTVGIITINNKLNICAHYYKTDFNEPLIKKVMDDVMYELCDFH